MRKGNEGSVPGLSCLRSGSPPLSLFVPNPYRLFPAVLVAVDPPATLAKPLFVFLLTL